MSILDPSNERRERRVLEVATMVAGVSICALIAAIVYFGCLRPIAEQNATAERRIAAAQSLLGDDVQIEQQNREMKQKLHAVQERVTALQAKIPSDRDDSGFLSQLSVLAKNSEVQLREFRPESVLKTGDHSELVVHVTGTAEYDAMCHFLFGLSKLPRALRVTGLSVRGSGRAGQECMLDLTLRLIFVDAANPARQSHGV